MFTINNATLLFVVKLETGTVQASADTIIPIINGQPKSYPNQQKGMI
ncbi:50S ribosomal protein L25 [Vibrio alginolyticus 12G01]|nr:50S ribosomal protein L25 [Vibrio alginolyticus 12G01]